MIEEGPVTEVPAPATPQEPDAAPQEATAVSRIWKAIQTLGDAVPAADLPEAVAGTAGSEVGCSLERARHSEDGRRPEGREFRRAARRQQNQPGDRDAETRGRNDAGRENWSDAYECIANAGSRG